jgi:hypothetical protein
LIATGFLKNGRVRGKCFHLHGLEIGDVPFDDEDVRCGHFRRELRRRGILVANKANDDVILVGGELTNKFKLQFDHHHHQRQIATKC